MEDKDILSMVDIPPEPVKQPSSRFHLTRKTVITIGLLLLLAGVAGAIQLSFPSTGNTTTASGTNLLALTPSTTPITSCQATPAGYVEASTGLSIAWTVPAGGSQTYYTCIWNNSGSSHNLVISGLGLTLPTGVTFSSTGSGSVAAGSTSIVSFTLQALASVTAGQPITGSIIIS